MTGRWQDFSETERDDVREVFVALHLSASVGAVWADHGSRSAPMSVSQLWNAVVTGGALPSAAQAGAVSPDDLAAMLDHVSVASVPRQAAAATESSAAATRTGRGVRISRSASRSGARQTYVTLEFDGRQATPGRLIALRPDGETAEVTLPMPVNGTIQLLMADDDPALAFLADPDCRIYLV